MAKTIEAATIKDNLKKLRHDLGLTQDEAARILGVTTTTLSRWANNRTTTIDATHQERLESLLHTLRDAQEAIRPEGISWWFKSPHPFLSDLSPLDLLASPTGIAKVRTLLGSMRWGLPGLKLPEALFRSPEEWEKRVSQVQPVRLSCRAYRLVPAIHAKAIEETGPSFSVGGRYNPKEAFGALYLSESPETTWREILQYYHGRTEFVPDQSLGEFQLTIEKCLDLTDETVRAMLGIEIQDIAQPMNHAMTQAIGRAAWTSGFEAIRFPSAVNPNIANMAVFRDQLSAPSIIQRIQVTAYKPSTP